MPVVRRFRGSRLKTVIVVADRGMVTKANLQLMRESDGVGWITALKAPQIKKLADQRRVAAVAVRRDQPRRDHRARGLPGRATGRLPQPARRSRARTQTPRPARRRPSATLPRSRPRRARHAPGDAQIGLAVGPRSIASGCSKHFQSQITDTSFTFARKRTRSPPRPPSTASTCSAPASPPRASTADVVRAYKARRSRTRLPHPQGPQLQFRPIHHRLEDRVRAHVFLCMLTYYLAWHLRQAWTAALQRRTPTHPARPGRQSTRSQQAEQKAQTSAPAPASAATATRACSTNSPPTRRNTIRLHGGATFDQLTQPTPPKPTRSTSPPNAPVTT